MEFNQSFSLYFTQVPVVDEIFNDKILTMVAITIKSHKETLISMAADNIINSNNKIIMVVANTMVAMIETIKAVIVIRVVIIIKGATNLAITQIVAEIIDNQAIRTIIEAVAGADAAINKHRTIRYIKMFLAIQIIVYLGRF